MSRFLTYLDPTIPVENMLSDLTYEERGGRGSKLLKDALVFLAPMKIKDMPTYEHSIRVSLLARKIADFIHLDGRALLYAGLLHDVGKVQTRLETLQKTEGWTKEDTTEVMKHVMDGYKMIRGCFDFSADIILWHHKFQLLGYPRRLPKLLHEYKQGTKILIPFYGRMLSLADVFDAMHRVNDKHGSTPLTGEQIKEKMLALNTDQKILVRDLFEAGIFTTAITGVV
jgi:putative nucleotidyltransferase with HDIG domain